MQLCWHFCLLHIFFSKLHWQLHGEHPLLRQLVSKNFWVQRLWHELCRLLTSPTGLPKMHEWRRLSILNRFCDICYYVVIVGYINLNRVSLPLIVMSTFLGSGHMIIFFFFLSMLFPCPTKCILWLFWGNWLAAVCLSSCASSQNLFCWSNNVHCCNRFVLFLILPYDNSYITAVVKNVPSSFCHLLYFTFSLLFFVAK